MLAATGETLPRNVRSSRARSSSAVFTDRCTGFVISEAAGKKCNSQKTFQNLGTALAGFALDKRSVTACANRIDLQAT